MCYNVWSRPLYHELALAHNRFQTATSKHCWQFKCHHIIPQFHNRKEGNVLFNDALKCSITMPTSRFFSMLTPPLIQLETLYIFLEQITLISLMTGPLSVLISTPIEHVWDSLDRRLRRRPNPPANVNELRQALIQEWNNIPQAEITTLVYSMCWRCTALINSRGGHTRY